MYDLFRKRIYLHNDITDRKIGKLPRGRMCVSVCVRVFLSVCRSVYVRVCQCACMCVSVRECVSGCVYVSMYVCVLDYEKTAK